MVRVTPPRGDRTRASASSHEPRQSTSTVPTAADFFIKNLPGLDPASRLSLYGGNLPSSLTSTPPAEADSDAHLYFFLAMNKHIPNRQRLVIWFNGGPGCSSWDGALIENGPLRVNKDGTLNEVENTSWNEYANVLYLDQPAGTGYSYVTKHDDVRELAEAAEQVVIFISNLYQVFPEFINMDTYLAGESYAGQYIPYIADAILKTTLISTRLKGLLIGNGWFSPREQYPAYLEYIVARKLVKVGSAGHKAVVAAVAKCDEEIKAMDARDSGSSKGMVLIGVCEEILGAVNFATMKGTQCMNSYNTALYETCGKEWPEALEQVTPYLRRPEVITALHAEGSRPTQWQQCSGIVGGHFWTPNSVPAVLLLPKLLEKIPILLYAGEYDLICAGLGIERMIEKLEWNGAVGFNGTESQEWFVDSALAGQWTTDRGLTYVNVLNSSHMVPMDVPLAAHDMLLRFMQVDTLHAAGHAAKVPSRIGKETEAVLGATLPDGSTLKENEDAAAAALASGDDGSANLEGGFDKNHELLYGPRRTALLFFLLFGLGIGLWSFFRWRTGRRRDRYSRTKGGQKQDSRRSGNSGLRGSAIRLEHSNASRADLDAAEAGRSRMYNNISPAPVETESVPVFDVGSDDEFDDVEGEAEEDVDERGDLGGDLGKQGGHDAWLDDDHR